jgi:hypothetical protein
MCSPADTASCRGHSQRRRLWLGVRATEPATGARSPGARGTAVRHCQVGHAPHLAGRCHSSGRCRGRAAPRICAIFAWLISHQPAVLFSQNKPATSNQPVVLFSQNKPAPAISQPNRLLAACHPPRQAAPLGIASRLRLRRGTPRNRRRQDGSVRGERTGATGVRQK